jgi:hypothetical protein
MMRGRTQNGTHRHRYAEQPRQRAFLTCNCAIRLASLLCTNPKSMRNWRKLELQAEGQRGRVCPMVGSMLKGGGKAGGGVCEGSALNDRSSMFRPISWWANLRT